MKNKTIFILLLAMISSGNEPVCPLEKTFSQSGLIDIRSLDSAIRVDLMYSSKANMFGEDLYDCVETCFLQPEVAAKLICAQKELRKRYPRYTIMVLDGARPRSIQVKMWNLVKETPLKSYVANPAKGSMHNYGAAVDVTIVDSAGNELEMGEPNPRACIVNKSPQEIADYLNAIKLTQKQTINRAVLKQIMVKAGFISLKHEWWHFTAYPAEETRKRFRIIE